MQLYIRFAIIISLLVGGCAVPGDPPLRIAISHSAGSAALYLAQESGLFDRYGVSVDIVELDDRQECWMAFEDMHVDASVVSYDEFSRDKETNLGTGILILVSMPRACIDSVSFAANVTCNQEPEVEALVGYRAEMMQNQQKWQRVLLAYEHARLLLSSGSQKYLEAVAARDRQNVECSQICLNRWEAVSIMKQDSLLGKTGPFAEMSPHWQGRLFLTEAVSSQLARTSAAGKSAEGVQVK